MTQKQDPFNTLQYAPFWIRQFYALAVGEYYKSYGLILYVSWLDIGTGLPHVGFLSPINEDLSIFRGLRKPYNDYEDFLMLIFEIYYHHSNGNMPYFGYDKFPYKAYYGTIREIYDKSPITGETPDPVTYRYLDEYNVMPLDVLGDKLGFGDDALMKFYSKSPPDIPLETQFSQKPVSEYLAELEEYRTFQKNWFESCFARKFALLAHDKNFIYQNFLNIFEATQFADPGKPVNFSGTWFEIIDGVLIWDITNGTYTRESWWEQVLPQCETVVIETELQGYSVQAMSGTLELQKVEFGEPNSEGDRNFRYEHVYQAYPVVKRERVESLQFFKPPPDYIHYIQEKTT